MQLFNIVFERLPMVWFLLGLLFNALAHGRATVHGLLRGEDVMSTLAAVRAHCDGRVWCVFGCGGERDRGKRPEMGRYAATLADRVIVTDDNPRGEDGDAIVAEIVAGMSGTPRVERDRRTAIAAAIAISAPERILDLEWNYAGRPKRISTDLLARLLGNE